MSPTALAPTRSRSKRAHLLEQTPATILVWEFPRTIVSRYRGVKYG